jgi:Ca2+-binding EF-hand superfamily protein
MFKTGLIAAGVLGLFVAGSMSQAAPPQKVDKSVPARQRNLALGEDEVKQLILLMDTNQNGKISKKEFMSFMEAEFDRLDTDQSGELDPKELKLSQIRASRPRPAVGK